MASMVDIFSMSLEDGPASADVGSGSGVELVVEVLSLVVLWRGVWGIAWSLRGNGLP
jgi:hypothetical protein